MELGLWPWHPVFPIALDAASEECSYFWDSSLWCEKHLSLEEGFLQRKLTEFSLTVIGRAESCGHRQLEDLGGTGMSEAASWGLSRRNSVQGKVGLYIQSLRGTWGQQESFPETREPVAPALPLRPLFLRFSQDSGGRTSACNELGQGAGQHVGSRVWRSRLSASTRLRFGFQGFIHLELPSPPLFPTISFSSVHSVSHPLKLSSLCT